MGPPILLAVERISGGRLRWLVSVRPGRRITLTTGGVADITAHWRLLESQVIPALERGLAVPPEDA